MYGTQALLCMLGNTRAFRPRRTIAILLALTAALVALAPGTGATDTNIVTPLTADPTNCSRRPEISADGSVVAFQSQADLVTGQNEDGTPEIFVVNSDGTGLAQLTRDPFYGSSSPTISADGSVVAFLSVADLVPGGNADHKSEIFVVNSDGTGLRQLTSDPDYGTKSALISADGSVVAFASNADLVSGQNEDHSPEIFVVNSDGTGLAQLTSDPLGGSSAPSISADGSVVAFESWADLVPGQNADHTQEIFVVNSDGTGLRQLTSDPGLSSVSPHISGDGSLIAFFSWADLVAGGNPDGSGETFVVNSDGTGVRQLSSESDAAATVFPAAISCDGTVIALECCFGPLVQPPQVRIVNSDGTGLRHVAGGPEVCAKPVSLSGDGSLLTVMTCMGLVPAGSPGAQPQVYVVDVGVLPFVQLTADPGYDTWFVRVSGDGSLAAFESRADLVPGQNGDNSWEVFVANSDGTGLLQLTNDAIYDSGPPVMSADGSVVAFQSAADLVSGQNADHFMEVFVVNSDGTGLAQLTSDPTYSSYSLSISADGSRVAFLSVADLVPGGNADHKSEIFVVNSDGTGLRQLTSDPDYGSASPLISGDGSVVAFASDADLVSGQNEDHSWEIFVINSDGTGLRQLTSDLAAVAVCTAISADGAAVVFTSCEGLGSVAAFIVNSDGTGLRHVAGGPGACAYPGSLSGDGSVIGLDSHMDLVTTGNLDGHSDAFVVSLAGSASTMTAAGADVTVEPMESVSITYETVAAPEETMVEHRAELTPPVPSEYTPVSEYHAVRTRADYTGPVTVELTYDPAEVVAAGGRTEQLRTLHLSPLTGRWEDVTESVDAANQVVVGQVSDLSWFVVSLSPYAVVADFSGTPTSGATPLTVDFTDQSLASPTSWLWDFGDGETSSEQHPSHAYETAGHRTVSLTATGPGGSDIETKVNYITVTFPDVALDFWSCDEILACVDAGIVSGYDDGLYRPDGPVTRDQMAVYIARSLAGGDSHVPDGPATPTFVDVPNTGYGDDGTAPYWAYKYVEYAVTNNVVQGYEYPDPRGETFYLYAPTATVTRDQMAVFIARSICDPTGDEGLVGYIPADPRNFPDVPATGYGDSGTDPYWAYRYIEYCVEHGVVQGYEYPDPDTPGETIYLYQPLSPVTRDQMAVFIARAFGLLR